MLDTHAISDAVGRRKMAEALNVSLKAISKQVVKGQFPPSWFVVMQELCCDAGVDCPPNLFGMRAKERLESGHPENKGAAA